MIAKRRLAADTGETLIEIIIAIAIMGIVASALLVGYETTISSTITYRGIATTDTALRSAAEEATSYWQLHQATAYACPPTPIPQNSIVFDSIPTGYAASISNVSYWQASSGNFTSTCKASVPELLNVKVANAQLGTSQNLGLVINDPASPPAAAAGAPTHLVFLSSGGPSDGAAGSPIPSQPEVAVEDANGNIVTSDLSQISLTIASGPSGGTLTNCGGSEFYGVVSFYNCEIDTIGTYTLQAKDGSLTSATSSSFGITSGPPATIKWTTSPGTSAVGSPLANQPVLTLYDAFNNIVTSDVSKASLAITTGTGNSNAQLTGCEQSEAKGVITFTGCEIDTAATGYTLTATDGSITAVSTAFNVTFGAPTQLVFTTSPGNASTPGGLSPQPVITVEDKFGNVVTNNNSTVTLAITTGTGTTGAAISGCTQHEANGVVSFTGCKINKPGTGYTLTATDGTLSSAVSTAFNVVFGPPSLLVWSTGPTGTQTHNKVFSPQPKIQIQDAYGDVLTSDNTTVTITAKNSLNQTVALTGCSVAAVNGVATFTTCTPTAASTRTVTLTATDTTDGLTKAYTTTFTIS